MLRKQEIDLMKLFRRKEIYKVESEPVDPGKFQEPKTAQEFLNRGMAFYARDQYDNAENDIRKAISMDRKYIDAFYSLGMILKAQKRNDEAIEAFQQTLDYLGGKEGEHNPKKDMLRRLAKGHVNEISLGDWNLEEEVWKRSG